MNFKNEKNKIDSIINNSKNIMSNSKIDVQDALSNLGLMSELESEVLKKYIINLNNYKSKSKLPPFTYSYVTCCYKKLFNL